MTRPRFRITDAGASRRFRLGDVLLKIAPSADAQSFEITPVGDLVDGGGLDLPRDASRLR